MTARPRRLADLPEQEALALAGAYTLLDPMPAAVVEDCRSLGALLDAATAESAAQSPAAATSRAVAGGPRPGRAAAPASPDESARRMTEAQLLAAVRDLAKLTGWEPYHTHNSQRSEPGWPDLVLASATQRRVLFVELKTATGRVSKHQERWLALLGACGMECAVWRPADLPEIARILRGKPIGGAA